jgi:hypothetical protein
VCRVLQAAHQGLAEMAGTAGHENLHDRPFMMMSGYGRANARRFAIIASSTSPGQDDP